MKKYLYSAWVGMYFTLVLLNMFGVLSFQVLSFQGLLVIGLGIWAWFAWTSEATKEDLLWSDMCNRLEEALAALEEDARIIKSQREAYNRLSTAYSKLQEQHEESTQR